MAPVPSIDNLREARERYQELVRQRAEQRGERYYDKALSAEGLHFIMSVIVKRKARVVLDMGLGFSTVVLGVSMATERCAYWGADHDGEWLAWMRDTALVAFRLLKPSDSHFRLTTIDELRNHDELTPSYFDAIIVDHGPQLDTRATDTPWLTTLLRPDGILLFDDWRPKHEGRIRRALAKADGEWEIGAAEHTRRFERDKAIGYATRKK